LKFPSFVKDKEFRTLMNSMLTKSPLSRLCKFSHIKANPWFNGFSWENLISLNIEPPFIPKIVTKDDDSKAIAYLSQVKVYLFF
jgi:hypothetical protein